MYIMTIGRAYPEKKTGMIGIFELEQAKALANAGNKVVYAFCDNRSVKKLRSISPVRKKDGSVEIYGRQLPIGGLPETIEYKIKTAEFKKLMKLIINENGVPDVIHIHFPLLTATKELIDYFKELGCRIICTEHWTQVQKKTISKNNTELLTYAVEKSDHFICVSVPLKKSVEELTGTKKEIQVVPNMVSDEFRFCSKASNNERYTFVAVGRLVPVKRFNVDIEAFVKAFHDNENVYLNIVGDGKCRKELENQINSTGLGSRIKMSGFKSRKEVADIYAESDCYVSASVLETFGVPFIEAWVTGLPSIGGKGGPIDDYFSKDNGILFEMDNSDDLARAMKQVYINRADYDRKKISESASALFSSESVAEQLIAIFNS